MNLTSELLGQRRIISYFLFLHFGSLIFFLRACRVMIYAFQRIIRNFFLMGQVHRKLRRWNRLITNISSDLSSSLIAEPMAELDRQSFIVNVGSPHCMLHIVVRIQYWHHLCPIVDINGKAQVRLALIRLMLIGRADPSVFVSISPSEGVGLFKHRTHRVLPWSHLTVIRGCYFIITHVAHTLLCYLLLISCFVKRLVDWLDWWCFVL